jgi:hypothetical protein
LTAQAGEALNIPVMIDSIVDLTGTGLESGDLVLYYDATALDVTGVSLGSLFAAMPGDWTVASRIDPLAGRVFITLAGQTPLEGFFEGEFVSLQAVVKADAPAGGTAINLAAGSRDPARFTQLNEGYLTLIPAPTDAANDPGVDGLLTISPASSVPAADQALAQLVNNQLLVLGTSAADRILIAPWGDQLRVRVGSQLLGDFPMPAGIAIDGQAGDDYIVLAGETRLAVAASLEDVVFAVGPVAMIEANSASDRLGSPSNAQDAALLQLLAAWGDESGGSTTPAGPGNRLVRYGRRS